MNKLIAPFFVLMLAFAVDTHTPAHGQQNPIGTGRTMRGVPTYPTTGIPRKPQLGEPVLKGDSAPIPINDLNGREMPYFIAERTECRASGNEYCLDSLRIDIPPEGEYCVHNLRVHSWNNAWYKVHEVAPDHVTVYFRAGYQPRFGFDKEGANIDLTLAVGWVPKGHYDPQRCLPRVPWLRWCHGRPECTNGTHDSGIVGNKECEAKPPVEKIRDEYCARLEYGKKE